MTMASVTSMYSSCSAKATILGDDNMSTLRALVEELKQGSDLGDMRKC